MEVMNTDFPGLLVVKPRIFGDDRGYFFESYNFKDFLTSGIDNIFIQDNQSKSSYGILRGLHYQLEPHAQAKLIRVLTGTILDIALDIRKGSPTYGKHYAMELSGDNQLMLYVPRGFAHGFVVLSKEALVFYKCDHYYHPEAERGIHYADPRLKLDWKVPADQIRVSEKDSAFPGFQEAEMNFVYQ